MKAKTIRAALAAAITIATGAMTANADGARRPMALMVMFDGLRADAIESGAMPNVMSLRNGTWQAGYKGAWSVTGQTAPGVDTVSAPNHVTIATGVIPSKHGVTANGQTSSGNYSTYPTWLKRVVDEKIGTSALFVYSWSEDGSLGPADGVTFLGNSDAQNATDLAALLASSDAPDATMYFIDAVDHAGHAGNYSTYTAGYTNAVALSDGYLGACLSAIASRPTFADEDWLILVTSDHGGYKNTHSNQVKGNHGTTIPIVIAGRNVAAGRIPGCPYNFDVCASALAHFGVTVSGLDATARDSTAVVDAARPLSAGLAAYLPFDEDLANKIDDGITSQANGMKVVTSGGVTVTNYAEVVASGGQIGGYCDIPSGSFLRLNGSQSLTYEGGDKSYTAVVWVKMNQAGSDPSILANKNWGSGNNIGTILCAGKSIQDYRGVTLNAGSGSSRIDVGSYFVEGNTKWTFYAITRRDDGVHVIYQGTSDGTLYWLATTFDAFVLKTPYPFCIGQDGTGAYKQKFEGGVDDVAIWTRALRHEDIRSIYENGLAGTALGDLVAAAPATATWTGAGTDPADMNDTNNWSCADAESNPIPGALPSWTTDVTISGATTFDLVGGKTIACKSVLFDNVTLSGNKDFSGLDITKIANGSHIDLRGKTLQLRGVNGENVAVNVCTITDSTTDTSNPGTLEIETPSGCTFVNTAIAMTGNLRLKTKGAGTFTASKANQSYTGGTFVETGTVKFGVTGSNKPFGAAHTMIEMMSASANIDAYSRYTDTYSVTLAGGKFLNTRNPACGSLTHHIGNLTLKADSEIVFDSQKTANADKTITDNVVWDLGGHTLTITFQGYDPDFDFAGTRNDGKGHLILKNGTVKTVGSTGWWQEANTDGTQGGSYDISTAIRHQGAAVSTVSNLTFRTPSNRGNPVGGAGGTAIHRVYGTFTPISIFFHNVEMLDGSTIDLSMKTGAWDTKCSSYNYYTTFAENATVTVNLAGREAEMESLAKGEVEGNENGYVMTWTTKPTNVTFRPKMANAEKYKLRPSDGGLRITRIKGIVITVR